MRNFFLLLYLLFASCNRSTKDLIELMVSEHKSDWKMIGIDYKWENLNYYDQTLFDCVIKINSSNLKNANSYEILFENGKKVMVEIIEFKQLQLAKKVYEDASKYAEKIRMTTRSNVEQLCEPIREWDFHYVLLDKKKLCLIGCIVGNFNFNNMESTLESDQTNLHEAREIYLYLKTRLSQ